MDMPSYALQLEVDRETGRWFIRVDEAGARMTFDSYEEGLLQLQQLLSEAKERERGSLPDWPDRSS